MVDVTHGAPNPDKPENDPRHHQALLGLIVGSSRFGVLFAIFGLGLASTLLLIYSTLVVLKTIWDTITGASVGRRSRQASRRQLRRTDRLLSARHGPLHHRPRSLSALHRLIAAVAGMVARRYARSAGEQTGRRHRRAACRFVPCGGGRRKRGWQCAGPWHRDRPCDRGVGRASLSCQQVGSLKRSERSPTPQEPGFRRGFFRRHGSRFARGNASPPRY